VGSIGFGRNRAACSGTAIADSGRSRRCPMLSTDIAPVFYRSSRGSLPATSTTDILGRERSQGTKTRPCPMRQRQAAEVWSAESRSGVAEATSRFSTEYYSGACFLSRIATRLDRAANEKTCCGEILFRGVRFSFAPHRHDCVSRRGALGARHARASSGRRTFLRKKAKNREYR
jgi:hypothetical protein